MTKSSASDPLEEADVQALLTLLDGQAAALWRVPQIGWQSRIDPPQGLLSGSFNPRHSGHDALRDAAEDWIGEPVWFELPLKNADKPALDIEVAVQRCRQFHDHPLLVTRAATFVEKARILPGATFVIGADTALRVIAPRFYGPRDDSRQAEADMYDCFDELRQLDCGFLVAARSLQGRVMRLSDVPLPAGFRDLFTELPEDQFRLDLSSSDLREQQ